MSYAFSAFALVVIIAIITFLFKNGIHEFRFLLSEFMMSSISYLLSGFSFINYVKSPSPAPILSPITVGGFVWLGGAFSAPAALQPYPIHYQGSYDSQISSFFIKNLRQENYSIYWPHSNLMTPSILYENSRVLSLAPTNYNWSANLPTLQDSYDYTRSYWFDRQYFFTRFPHSYAYCFNFSSISKHP